MTKRTRSRVKTVYQIKITLTGINPPIWRRIQVPSDTTLSDLHLMLQAAMGWQNCHLHSFTIDGLDYSYGDPDLELDMEDESQVRLDDVASDPDKRFSYMYDFGDGWEHDVVIEEVAKCKTQAALPGVHCRRAGMSAGGLRRNLGIPGFSGDHQRSGARGAHEPCWSGLAERLIPRPLTSPRSTAT
jgi:hypothetical protein